MMIMEDDQKSKAKDNFLFDNLPGIDDMLSKTLPNKDLLYYPNNFSQINSLNVFDFAYQRKGGEAEDAFSGEKTGGQKNKKTGQKYPSQRFNQNQKHKTAGSKNIYQNNQRFSISQTIQPESNWLLLKDFNKRILEKRII